MSRDASAEPLLHLDPASRARLVAALVRLLAEDRRVARLLADLRRPR